MALQHRARKQEQKEERRHAILEAAWALFQETHYLDITMTMVADRLGMAKGTLYLYFKTKEELFLELQSETLGDWLGSLEAQLLPFEGSGDTAGVVRLIRESMGTRTPVIRLLGILHGILERNVPFASALAFKQTLVARMASLGARLEACLPYLLPGEGARFALHGQALMVGLFQLEDPSPVVREVLKEPGLELLNVTYADEVMVGLEAILLGYQARARRLQVG